MYLILRLQVYHTITQRVNGAWILIHTWGYPILQLGMILTHV